MQNLAIELQNLEWKQLKRVLEILAKKTKKGILPAGKSNLNEYCEKIAIKLNSKGYENTLNQVISEVINKGN